MIDIQTEKTISLAEASRLVPSIVPGKPVATCTLTRWITTTASKGCGWRPCVLGGRWLTTKGVVSSGQFVPADDTLTRTSNLPSQSPAIRSQSRSHPRGGRTPTATEGWSAWRGSWPRWGCEWP